MSIPESIFEQTLGAFFEPIKPLIDDAAVTPKYVTGLPAARELPIVWKTP